MFEVFSNGQVPYKDLTKLPDVRKAVLLKGRRLKPPADMPAEESAIMQSCFNDDPTSRPSFDDLKRIYKESCGTGAVQKLIRWISTDKVELAPVRG
ncbi:Protein kinase domain-containing protein [Trichostrongylus colubriformis]|uniref:Protein kinase domain-containing protein n=1 Tax=Trichostrongylus colubriformis TaxID=6319 RepID=A0AAN8FKF5_TRICO